MRPLDLDFRPFPALTKPLLILHLTGGSHESSQRIIEALSSGSSVSEKLVYEHRPGLEDVTDSGNQPAAAEMFLQAVVGLSIHESWPSRCRYAKRMSSMIRTWVSQSSKSQTTPIT